MKNKNIFFISAKNNFINISPNKFNKILNFIKNKKCINMLHFLKQFSQTNILIIWKTLNSVIYTAIKKYNLDINNLKIVKIFITQGPILKRKIFKSKGRCYEIQKKMSHLTIIISNI
jgi:large subunit ribosomal protein L22